MPSQPSHRLWEPSPLSPSLSPMALGHPATAAGTVLSSPLRQQAATLGWARQANAIPALRAATSVRTAPCAKGTGGVTRVTMGPYRLAGRCCLPACRCNPQPGFCRNGVNAASFSFWNKLPPNPEPSRAIVAGNHGNGRLAHDGVCLCSCP